MIKLPLKVFVYLFYIEHNFVVCRDKYESEEDLFVDIIP